MCNCPACHPVHEEQLTPEEIRDSESRFADDFLNAYAGPIAEARKRECNHAWPMADEGVDPDARCLKGCGATYELWKETHR